MCTSQSTGAGGPDASSFRGADGTGPAGAGAAAGRRGGGGGRSPGRGEEDAGTALQVTPVMSGCR
ncbi:hypothetical protein F6456_27840 [Streptomyces sp. LBUM 1484]|nr:hypothetical protein [Streptomyces sp. LBUM 1484]